MKDCGPLNTPILTVSPLEDEKKNTILGVWTAPNVHSPLVVNRRLLRGRVLQVSLNVRGGHD